LLAGLPFIDHHLSLLLTPWVFCRHLSAKGDCTVMLHKNDTMTTLPPTIDNLMKVSLTMESGTQSPGSRFEFIYGVGSQGITPFEKALFGKGVGDQIQFDISPADYCDTIGHLELPMLKQTGIMKPLSLQVTIDAIAKATDLEVVKAMAAGGSCDDCGCGCGGH
jgi:hypothetical protein